MAPTIIPLLKMKRIVFHFISQTDLPYHLPYLLFCNNKHLWPSEDQRYFPGIAVDCITYRKLCNDEPSFVYWLSMQHSAPW